MLYLLPFLVVETKYQFFISYNIPHIFFCYDWYMETIVR